MTNGPVYIDTQPKLIPARISIHHLQLRDLLQPAGVGDRVLFVNRLKIEQADFASLKPPTTYCTLDFLPNCLATSCGLLAAGGQHSELALRPLHTPSSSAHAISNPDADRYPAPWLLRTPTGGSINNAINIQPDCYASPSSSVLSASASASSSLSRRKGERVHVSQPGSESSTIWARDEPRSLSSSSLASSYLTTSTRDAQHPWQITDCTDRDDTAVAYGFDPSASSSASLPPSASSSLWRSTVTRRPAPSTTPRSNSEAERRQASASESLAQAVGPVKIMVSNNDQSIKSYQLRPPMASPGTGGRIESGLPGLSKTSTLHFPTAINHSSLSPDRRTLVAVGDTPEVFIYHIRPNGDFDKVAIYSASNDASFSTTWSPDGSKFAVASQDGIVSVWDVRSSYPLASLSTAQAGMAGGNGAARVAKFSPGGDMLAFTEHRNYFHVVDTNTFSNVQRMAAPVVPSSSISSLLSSTISMLEGGGGVEETDLLHPGPAATVARTGHLGLTGIGLLSNPPSSGTSPSSTHRTQILLNAAQAHREASTVLDRFRVTSSVAPSYSTYESLVNQRIGPDDVTHPLDGGGEEARLGRASQRREEGTTNVSGLCWDPSGEHVYVSTERVIARYTVLDPRQASFGAQLL